MSDYGQGALRRMKSDHRLLWFALLATLVWGLLMSVEAGQYRKVDCGGALQPASWSCLANSPIANLELTQTPRLFRQYVDCDTQPGCDSPEPDDPNAGEPVNRRWNTNVARVNTAMDFLFIGLYWLVIVLLAREQSGVLARIVYVTISAAAVFDIAENVRLLQALQAVHNNVAEFHTPALFSGFKWSFFALSLLLLGSAVAVEAGSRAHQTPPTKKVAAGSYAMAALLILSGVFTLVAVVLQKLTLVFPALLLLSAALLIALCLCFPFKPLTWDRLLTWIEFAYLIRFQLIALVLLALALPAGYFLAPSFFIGLFDEQGFRSFIFAAWAAFEFAFTVMLTSRMVLAYGPQRFTDLRGLPSPAELSWQTTGMFAALALPCIVMMSYGTRLALWTEIAGIPIALAMAILVLWLAAKLHRFTPDPHKTAAALYPFSFVRNKPNTTSSYLKPAASVLSRLLPERLQPGILDTPGESGAAGRLRSGHALAGITLGMLIVIYLAGAWAYSPAARWAEHRPAAMFYLLFLLIFLTWLFSGLAFLLDVIRVPVLITALVTSMLFGSLDRGDHEFEIRKTGEQAALEPKDVIAAWQHRRAKDNASAPLVVVATAGGGIRAAAWATYVLTGLSEETNDPSRSTFPFDSSLVLVSSVSGGSLGNLYVVGSYVNGRLPLDSGVNIRRASEQSSLSAVGWGLLYPDALRTIPGVGLAISQDHDRGWTLEKNWLSNWKPAPKSASNLASWIKDLGEGERPAVIFNATAAESGQRFLIGTTHVPDVPSNAASKLQRPDIETLQFVTAFKGYDVDVSTAARASATFPWVSPMTRPSPEPAAARNSPLSPFRMHLGDGGYYDNSGIMSATQWLVAAVETIKDHPVLLVLIDSTPGVPDNGQRWSWQRQLFAPVGTLLQVRTSSQQTRAAYELELARRVLCAANLHVEVARMYYPADALTPMSWHLTPDQIEEIDAAWKSKDPSFVQEKQKIESFLNQPYSSCQTQP